MQNWLMSETVADAAVTACAAPIPASGTVADSGVGNSMITMLSQNAARMRKNMTLPCVLHGFFTVVAERLAEAIEGEVGSVRLILRMFETSFRRGFLKFEPFSSLRNDAGQRLMAALENGAASLPWRRICVHRGRIAVVGRALVPPSFGNRAFTIRSESDLVCICICRIAPARGSRAFCLSVRLSGL